MGTENLKHNERNDTDHRERLLDAALAKYSDVEPRAGLESRILANLRAQPVDIRQRLWLRRSSALALAVAVVVAVALAWKPGKQSEPAIVRQLAAPMQAPRKPEKQVVAIETNSVRPMRKKVAVRLTHPAEMAAAPKLDQFPSPQPLSAEEIALTHYVKNFPKEAELVARAQEEYALETQKEMNDAGLEIRPSASNQQER